MMKYIQVLLIGFIISCSSREPKSDISSLEKRLATFKEAFENADVGRLSDPITRVTPIQTVAGKLSDLRLGS